MEIKTTARLHLRKYFLTCICSFIFLTVSAQKEENQEFRKRSYVGTSISYRHQVDYFNGDFRSLSLATTFVSASIEDINFGLSFERQVKKNWYYELSVPFLKFRKQSQNIFAVSSPTTFSYETTEQFDVGLSYEYGFNGARFFIKNMILGFAASIRATHSNKKTYARNSISDYNNKFQNFIGMAIYGNPKITYVFSERLRLDLKLTHSFFNFFYLQETSEDSSTPSDQNKISSLNLIQESSDGMIGLAIKVGL